MPVRLGVGVSAQADISKAGHEAAQKALIACGDSPHLILLFTSIRFAQPKLLESIRLVTGNVPLVGCTDAGSLSGAGLWRRSAMVVALHLPGVQVATAIVRHLSNGARVAGEVLGKSLRSCQVRDPKAILLFPDGLSTSNSEFLRSVEFAFNQRLPIVGATAGDDCFFQRTFQFFNDQVLTDSASAVLLGGDLNIGIGSRHGWMPVGTSRSVTRAKGHVIHQLDDRPAVSIYEDYLGIRKEEFTDEPLARIALTYPLGISVKKDHEYLIRDPIRVGRRGSLICTGDISEGRRVRLMIGGYESVIEAAQQAAHEAVERIGRDRLSAALVFLNVARQKRLGSDSLGEIQLIRDVLGPSVSEFAGFYGYGEFAPDDQPGSRGGGPNRFGGESAVVVAFG